MFWSEVFAQLDGNILTVSLAFVGIWLTIHFAAIYPVGDLGVIRARALRQLAAGQSMQGIDLVKFMDLAAEESYVLLLVPRKKSPRMQVALWGFAIVSVATIAKKSFFPTKIDYIYAAYCIALVVVCVFLYYEYAYFREFRTLEKKYPSGSKKGSQPPHVMVNRSAVLESEPGEAQRPTAE